MVRFFANVETLEAHTQTRLSSELADVETYLGFRQFLDNGLSLSDDAFSVLLDVIDFHTGELLHNYTPHVSYDEDSLDEYSVDEFIEEELEARREFYADADPENDNEITATIRDWRDNFGIEKERSIMFFQGIDEEGGNVTIETLVRLVDEWADAQGEDRKWNPSYAPAVDIDPRILNYAKESSPEIFLERFCYVDEGIITPLTCWEMAECLRLAYES